MNCKHCDNPLTDGAKFCGKCGKSVSAESSNKNDKREFFDDTIEPRSVGKIFKKILQIISVILFICALSTVNSSSAHPSNEVLDILSSLSTIAIVIAFFGLLSEWWKNRKTGKKWFGWRWIVFLIIISIVGLGTKIFSEAVTIAQQKALTTQDSWAIYSAPETNFSAKFPSNPVHDTKTQESPNGAVKIDTYKQADHTASILYAVNVSELPSGVDVSDSTTFLQNTVSLSAKNGTVLDSSQTTNNGYPAISYYIEFDHPSETSMIKGVNILVGHRLYQLLTGYDKPQENLLEYDKFVDSFQIK